MESLSLYFLDEILRGILGKAIGIGLVFSVAKSTVSQQVSFPRPSSLKHYGVKFPPSIESRIDDARKQHKRLTLLAWSLLLIYFLIYQHVVLSIPEGADELDGFEMTAILALVVIALLALVLTYYLTATESKAKDLARYGSTTE